MVRDRKPPSAKAPLPAPAAYFLLLSPHERRGRRFVQLKAPTVLAWFQQAWRAAVAGREWDASLRGDVYGLGGLFDRAQDGDLAAPTNGDELVELIEAHVSYERDLEAEPHFVHVETDDDEAALEYFFFDDVFLQGQDALDRLPAPDRRAVPIDDEDDDDDDGAGDVVPDDGYDALIARVRQGNGL